MNKILLLLFLQIYLCTSLWGQEITFSEHIAPIIFKNCTPCHQPKGIAPFALVTYEDVAKRAKLIQYVTQSKYMPPWKADHYATFANERILSEKEISAIKDWVTDLAPEGNKKKLPVLPKLHEGSQIGKADLVLHLNQPFKIKGDNLENFVMFKIPFNLETDKNVSAIEFIPDNKKILHHVNFAIYAVDEKTDINQGVAYHIVSPQMNYSDVKDYLVFMQKLVYYGGWIPGASPQKFSKEMGFVMPKKGVIILTIHYGPSPIDEIDNSYINVFFKSEEIKREVKSMSIGSGGDGTISPSLVIYPNNIQSHKARWVAEEDMSLLFVWPHMHLLGTKIKSYAVYEKDTIPLVNVPEWDFNWQEAYQFKKPVKIPKGATIIVEGTFDNTSKNPNNPFSPPRIIYSEGMMETKNEMLNLIILYLIYKEKDEELKLSPE